MSEKYVYHGIDITLDVYEKIKAVVELLALREQISFEDAFILFAASPVYDAMQNTESLYWYESPEYLIEEYYRKRKCR